MKKSLLTLSLSLFGLCFSAQTELYQKIKKVIIETHPEIITDNRLIALNVWNVSDLDSREANKNFDKAYKVYEYAKLKGGVKGMIAVAVNTDNLSNVATIAFTKDSVTKLISLKAEDLNASEIQGIKNIVFDSSGEIVYKDLPPKKISEMINQLITR
jgi:hypothetical protein